MQRVVRRKMSNVMFWQVISSGIDLKPDRYTKSTVLDASGSPARCNLTPIGCKAQLCAKWLFTDEETHCQAGLPSASNYNWNRAFPMLVTTKQSEFRAIAAT